MLMRTPGNIEVKKQVWIYIRLLMRELLFVLMCALMCLLMCVLMGMVPVWFDEADPMPEGYAFISDSGNEVERLGIWIK